MLHDRLIRALRLVATLAGACAAGVVSAQTPPDYDFQWSTIGAVGNAPYHAPPDVPNIADGRGSVSYQYRMSRLEITTAQWIEFQNSISTLVNPPVTDLPPILWGGSAIGRSPTGRNIYALTTGRPNAARLAVGGLTWRDAAVYCNWLTNGKAATMSALMTGAYDVSTFHDNPDGTLGDTPVHLPSAQYWIPNLDEWLKAAHYDPNRYGENQPGWWMNQNRSDTLGVIGPPGQGTTNAGYHLPGNNFAGWAIPLGSYVDQQSPWGLWDTSGGAQEWLEDLAPAVRPYNRLYVGSSAWMDAAGVPFWDPIGGVGGDSPGSTVSDLGFRIASSVPSPGAASLVLIGTCLNLATRRKRVLEREPRNAPGRGMAA